jgi:hypothetical protein
MKHLPLLTLLLVTAQPHPQPISARYLQGTFHGFLELRSQDNQVLASGDSTQVVHAGLITARTLFTFKDGSIDDETTVFTQGRTFHLITDRHIQRGPAFPHPTDVFVDTRTSQITVRTAGKDGKEQVDTTHLTLPANLANGMVPLALENLPPDSPGATLSMVVAAPKPRIVKLIISNVGEDPYSIAGASRKAIHYTIRIDLGGIAAIVAPIIDKQPPNIQIWIVAGPAPTFAREIGPLYPEGPIATIQLASPTWPDTPKPAN